ncbi:hypothetical protein SRHO_G00312330 [Serrasalmus rhombeus]
MMTTLILLLTMLGFFPQVSHQEVQTPERSSVELGQCSRFRYSQAPPPALRRRDTFGTVVIHVGTNDISDRRIEVLKEHYQMLLDYARKKTDARIVISDPLLTYPRGSERFSRLFALQS